MDAPVILRRSFPRIVLGERAPGPRWFVERPHAKTYYRAHAPVRAVPGAAIGELRVSAGGETRVIDLASTLSLLNLHWAADQAEITVHGLPEPPMPAVFPLETSYRGHADDPLLQVISAFRARLFATAGNCWVDTDDDILTSPSETLIDATAWQYFATRLPVEPQRRARAVALARAGHAAAVVAVLQRPALRAAAGVIVATPVLAEVYGREHPNVVVIENAIDPDEFLPYDRPPSPDGRADVGFAGNPGKTIVDLPPVRPFLFGEAARAGARLHGFGVRLDGEREGNEPAVVEELRGQRLPVVRQQWAGHDYFFHGFIKGDMQTTHRRLGILDIAIGPLSPDAFNRARSASKWMEHALHGTAMVLPDMPPFDCVEDGVTGCKYDSVGTFAAALRRLLADPDKARRIGAAARAEVLARHTLAARAPQWRAFAAGWPLPF